MTAKREIVKVKNAGTPEQTSKTIFDELRRDLADWMTTNHDEVWRPDIELTREENEFAARMLVPGIDSKHLEVMIAPDVLLIKGEMNGRRKVFRSIKFPRPVNPDKVQAELKDGMLCVRSEIAGVSKVNVFMPKAA
jgi:HSP20 family molecular chaperone IbpA